jgi:hypothetical protein
MVRPTSRTFFFNPYVTPKSNPNSFVSKTLSNFEGEGVPPKRPMETPSICGIISCCSYLI